MPRIAKVLSARSRKSSETDWPTAVGLTANSIIGEPALSEPICLTRLSDERGVGCATPGVRFSLGLFSPRAIPRYRRNGVSGTRADLR